MNELNIKIKDMIYTINGIQVMLDSDLAKLYGVETKYLNRQVKRNIDRFPEDYMFQLSFKEYNSLRCQNVTAKKERGGRTNIPFVFTEKGIYMLGNILKSKEATEMSLFIINKFVELKTMVNMNDIYRLSNIESKLLEHDNKINELLKMFETKGLKVEYIFYEGEIYDAYSLLLNIFNRANKEIIIFDNYMNNKVLDIIDKNINIILIRNKNVKDEVVDKYLMQYKNLSIYFNDGIHDRFIIIDREYLYHIGMSLKDVGKKCFAISLLHKSNINRLIKDILQ